MTGVDFSLLIGLVVAAGLSWRNRRGLLWLAVGAASYISATIAWRADVSGAVVVTAIGDALVCLSVYFFARYQWEIWVFRLFQASLAISLVYLIAGVSVLPDIDHSVYAVGMEAINWLLLLLIGGPSAIQGVRGSHGIVGNSAWYRVRGFVLAAWQDRKTPPFTHA